MKVTVLGCGSAYPRAGGACTGYLVEHDGTRLWIDAGNGTLSNLQKLCSYRDVDALVLSHVHADHVADVIPLMYALGFDPLFDGSLPLRCTEPTPALLRSLVQGENSKAMFGRVFDVGLLPRVFEIGGMHVEPFATVHTVETYGMRISADGRTFVFTADTAWFDELPQHCRNADLLICEATYVAETKSDPGIHLWAAESGKVATKAAAERLVLTHIWPTIDPAVSVDEASQVFDGPVEAAVEGRVYDV